MKSSDDTRRRSRERRTVLAISAVSIVAVAILLLRLAIFAVHDGEQVLIVRLGEPLRTIGNPGWHLTVPLVDRVVRMTTGPMEFRPNAPCEVRSLDGTRFVVRYLLQYRITDPLRLYPTIMRDRGLRESVLGAITFAGISRTFGSLMKERLLSSDQSSLTATVIKGIERTSSDFGISITDLHLDVSAAE